MEASDLFEVGIFFWSLSTAAIVVVWLFVDGLKWPMRYLGACLRGRSAAENVMSCWDGEDWDHKRTYWFCSRCGYSAGSKALHPSANACPTCRQERWRVGRIALFDGERHVPPPGLKIIGEELGIGLLSLSKQ